jgi:hypothetical protein
LWCGRGHGSGGGPAQPFCAAFSPGILRPQTPNSRKKKSPRVR